MFTRWGFTTVFNLASTMASANTIRDRLGGVTGPEVLTVGAPFYPLSGAPVYARPIYTAAHLPSAEITTQEAAVAHVSKGASQVLSARLSAALPSTARGSRAGTGRS